MKHLTKTILILISLWISPQLYADENYLFISVNSTVMASDPDDMARTLSGWTEDQGGYFTHLSTDLVILRFPWKKAGDFRSFLGESSDDVFSYSSSSSDLRESILSYKSGIEARSEILKKNMQLVESADFSGTLYLEQEILRLMSEIEQLKGGLRKAENDREMAQAYIQINFQSHSLPENIPSSFGWINTLNFSRFIGGSFYGKARGRSYDLDYPSGFALVDNRTFFRGISPEGVRFQIRTEKNYPQKDLSFWSSALVNHMDESGYRKRDEGMIRETAEGSGIFAIEWGLSMGSRDYLYLTAIMPWKNKIYIFESAGEIEAFNDYRDSLYDALESFSP